MKVEDEIKFSKATKVSDDAKDFILICLEKDPRDRYTITELLDHPFLTQQENVPLAELY
jgi:serine/threonine protein kinase